MFFCVIELDIRSAQESRCFSAWNASGAPSAQDLGCFPAPNAFGVHSALVVGHFSAQEDGVMELK